MACKYCKYYLKPDWCDKFDCDIKTLASTIGGDCPEFKEDYTRPTVYDGGLSDYD